jgi:glycosyltransferase involved in cell wall biosynthesis
MVSVIIPCYNSEKFVARAVDSVLKQTYRNYEIILVDNGSTDHTLRILESYQSKYPDLVKVFQESKKGAPAARNKGLHAAKGEWIQFLDSDNELLPEKLEKQVEVAGSSGADLIIGDYFECYVNSKGVLEKRIQVVESKNIWKSLIISRLGNTCSNLWRKEAVLRVGGWDETKTSSQEINLLFRMLKQNVKLSFCPVPLNNMHFQKNSVSRSGDQKRCIEIANNYINLRLEIKQYLQGQNRLTEELNRVVNVRIYEYLLPFRGRVPEYVTEKLSELRLVLPFTFYVRRYLRKTKNYLRKYKNAMVGSLQ